MEWVEITKTFGVPVSMLAAMSLGIWVTIKATAAWAKPHADKWIGTHLGLMDALTNESIKRSQSDEKMAEALKAQSDSFRQMQEYVSKFRCGHPGGMS